MKKTVVLLGLLLFGLGIKAQEQKYDSVEKFYNLIDESVNYYASDENISRAKVEDEFFDKLNLYELNPPVGSNQNIDFTDWLTDNLSKTKFRSVEEGVQLLYIFQDNIAQFSKKQDELLDKLEVLVENLNKEQITELFNFLISRYAYIEGQNKIKVKNELSESIIRNSDTTAQIKHSNP
ncbi:hypothetical protein [Paenimyroides ceti]